MVEGVPDSGRLRDCNRHSAKPDHHSLLAVASQYLAAAIILLILLPADVQGQVERPSPGPGECVPIDPATFDCRINGTTTSQVISPGSRIIKQQSISRFIDERYKVESIAFDESLTPSIRASQSSQTEYGDIKNFTIDVFGGGVATFEDQSATAREAASETNRLGGNVGLVFGWPRFAIAVAIDYADEHTDFTGDAFTDAETDRREIGFALSGALDLGGGFYAVGGGRIADIDFEATRSINVVGEGDEQKDGEIVHSNGSSDGLAYSVYAGLGYATEFTENWYVGASVSLGYEHQRIDDYLELFIDGEGFVGGEAYRFDTDERDSLLSRVELEIARRFDLAAGAIVATAHAAYQHEFANDSRKVSVFPLGVVHQGEDENEMPLPRPTIDLITNDPDRNYFPVGAEIEALFSGGRFSTSVGYDTILGHSFIDQHTISATLTWRF